MFKPGDKVVCVKPKDSSPFGRGLSKGSVYIIEKVSVPNRTHVSLRGMGSFMYKVNRFVLQRENYITYHPKNKPYIET